VNAPKNSNKKRPGALWLMFYGRQRRGFPFLLLWVTVGLVLGTLAFSVAGGPDIWRAVFPVVVGALLLAALVFALFAALWPRKRR
jgi:hypothetical protein